MCAFVLQNGRLWNMCLMHCEMALLEQHDGPRAAYLINTMVEWVIHIKPSMWFLMHVHSQPLVSKRDPWEPYLRRNYSLDRRPNIYYPGKENFHFKIVVESFNMFHEYTVMKSLTLYKESCALSVCPWLKICLTTSRCIFNQFLLLPFIYFLLR